MSDRKRFVFRSVFNSGELAYVWDNDRWEFRNPGIHNPVAQFQTYGDGLIQHSPEGAVSKELLADFLISLSAHLRQNPADVEVMANRWPHKPDGKRVEFLRGLRYDESKRRYYNAADCKVSSAESKRHDKRWDEVPTSADGGFEGTMRLVVGAERHSLLELVACGLAVADGSDTGYYDRRELLKWIDADGEFNRQFVVDAYRAVQAAVDAHQARHYADGAADCLTRNVENWNERERAKVEAEETARQARKIAAEISPNQGLETEPAAEVAA